MNGKTANASRYWSNRLYERAFYREDHAGGCTATIGFNTNYFSELFKKETGENFSNYLLGIRMEKAKQMLRDTKIPVYEIGESVGYKDAKYFSQQFMKVVGVKPAEYRKLYY